MNQAVFSLVVTLCIQMLVSFGAVAGPVLAPIASQDLGLAAYLVGAYVAIMYLFAAVASLASGGFILRFGPLRVSQVCLVFAAAGLAIVALWGTPAGAIASAALVGIGYGPVTPASSHLLARTTPPDRINLVFSVKQTGVPFGNALAGVILPALALALDWQSAVLFSAVACIIVAAASEPLRRALDTDLEVGRRLWAFHHIVGPLRLVFHMADLRLLAFSSLFFGGMQTSLTTFLVTYLNDRLGFSIVMAGLALTVAQAAGVVGRILWGYVADRLVSPMRLLAGLALAMSASAILVGLFTPSWPLAAILAVCASFGGTAIAWNGVLLAQVARYSPPGRAGEVTGATTFMTFLGVTLVPGLFSAVLSTIGSYLVGYSAIGCTTLLTGLSCLRRDRRGARRR